jgi:hypothetical protein
MSREEILDAMTALVAMHAEAEAKLAACVVSLRSDCWSWERIAAHLREDPEYVEARFRYAELGVIRPLGWMPGDPD